MTFLSIASIDVLIKNSQLFSQMLFKLTLPDLCPQSEDAFITSLLNCHMHTLS